MVVLEHVFAFGGELAYADLMTPPRSLDPAAAGAAVPSVDEYGALCDEIARTQGIINLAEARLVELTRQGLEAISVLRPNIRHVLAEYAEQRDAALQRQA